MARQLRVSRLSFPVDCRGCTASLLFGKASSDIQVKELEKRTSGQIFELILSPQSKESVPNFLRSPTKKKDLSLEEIQKLEAAKEWRKSHEADIQKQLAEKWEQEKVIEDNNFSKMTGETDPENGS